MRKTIKAFSLSLALLLLLSLVPSFVCAVDYSCTYNTFKTLGGNSVFSMQRIYELSEAEKAERNQAMYELTGLYPTSEPSIKYNCHSYAWCNEVSYSINWINDPTPFISDGHTSSGSMVAGNIAVYSNDSGITHSAVIFDSSPTLGFSAYSKWGECGVYTHYATNVPPSYLGAFTFYVRDTSHDLQYTSIDNSSHTCVCSKCSNATTTSPHSLRYTSSGATQHNVICSVCNHSHKEDHSFVSVSYDVLRCKKCGYSKPAHQIFD